MHALTRHRLLRPGDARRWLLLLISTLISILLALFLAAPIARVESPFNDTTQPRPQGGDAGAASEPSSSGTPVLPAILPGYAELPPPLPCRAPTRQQSPGSREYHWQSRE